MDIVSTPPGTRLISFEPEGHELPIVGWVACGQARCLPVVPGRHGGLVCGDAYVSLDGRVLDPVLGKVFEDEPTWRAFVEEEQPYRPGMPHPALEYPTKVGGLTVEPRPENAARSAPPITSGAMPAVSFAGKTYAKQSFWQAPANNPTVIFVLEPETKCPISGATKITREAFYELRKVIPVVSQETLMAAPVAEPVDEDDDDDLDMV